MTQPSREDCIAEGGAAFAAIFAEQDALPPRAAAERAHREGGPSVEQLEDLIRAERGLEPRGRRGAA